MLKRLLKSERGPSGPSKNHVAWAQILSLLLWNPDGLSMDDLYNQSLGCKQGKSRVTLSSQLTNIRTALAVFGLGTLKTENGLMKLELADGVKSAFGKASSEALELVTQRMNEKDD